MVDQLERNKAMLRMRESGRTYAEIGKIYGLGTFIARQTILTMDSLKDMLWFLDGMDWIYEREVPRNEWKTWMQAARSMKSAGIRSSEKLMGTPEEKLIKIRGFGINSLNIVQRWKEEYRKRGR